MESRFDLLTAIDALVHADGAYSALTGRLAIAVADEAGTTQWWVAEFGEGVLTNFTNRPPETAPDAALLLSEVGAAQMLRGEVVHDENDVLVLGDRRLLEKFSARYFKRTVGLNHQMLRFQSARPSTKQKARLS